MKPALEELETRYAPGNLVYGTDSEWLLALEQRIGARLDQLDQRTFDQFGIQAGSDYVPPVEVVMPFFDRLDDGYAKIGLQNAGGQMDRNEVTLSGKIAAQRRVIAGLEATGTATFQQLSAARLQLLKFRVEYHTLVEDHSLVTPVATGPTEGTLGRFRDLVTELERRIQVTQQMGRQAQNAAADGRSRGVDDATQWRLDRAVAAWQFRFVQERRDLNLIRGQVAGALGP